jgi:peptidyl-prolyl cis-trans isomerase B (cyclophilin B)
MLKFLSNFFQKVCRGVGRKPHGLDNRIFLLKFPFCGIIPSVKTENRNEAYIMKKLVLVLLLVFVACSSDDYENGYVADELTPINVGDVALAEEEHVFFLDGTIYERLLDSPAVMLQLTPVDVGEELAIIHTNFGDVTVRFFPSEAPLAVENFVTHAMNGYYDGLIFHRVIENFMIQGGCPLGLGNGGESIWGEGFGLERSFNLLHFRGALATAHSGRGGTIGSQFYIVQSPAISAQMANHFRFINASQDEIVGHFMDGRHIYGRDIHPAYGLEFFAEHGGTPHLDWHWNESVDRVTGEVYNYGHTVFGHVVDGMDVIDAIAGTPTIPGDYHDAGRRFRPLEDVIIERISFFVYEGGMD